MRRAPRTLVSLLLLAAASIAQAPRDPMLGVVLGPDGAPAAGASVIAYRAGDGLLELPIPGERDDLRQVDAARTDRQGRFALQLPIGLPCRVVVDHPRFARWQRDRVLPAPDWTIHLAEPSTYRCELELASGGPAAADVRAFRSGTRDEVFRGRTDAQGKLRVERVEPGELVVELTPDAAPSPEPRRVTLVAGAEHVDAVRLAGGQTLTGRVIDEQGAAVAGALVGEGWDLHRAVTTDAEGRYTLRGRGSWQRAEIACAAPGFVSQCVELEPTDAGATHDFRLRRGHAVRGRVVDERGEPLEGVRVAALGILLGDASSAPDVVQAHSDDDGNFELRGLSPTCQHMLVLRRDGLASSIYALPGGNQPVVQLDAPLLMKQARIVHGVLRDADGRPIADASVWMTGCNSDHCRFRPDAAVRRQEAGGKAKIDNWTVLRLFVGRRRVGTDHAGRFAFGDLPDGEFELTVSDGRGHSHEVRAAVTTSATPVAPIELRVR